jgi:hypothetical protein
MKVHPVVVSGQGGVGHPQTCCSTYMLMQYTSLAAIPSSLKTLRLPVMLPML